MKSPKNTLTYISLFSSAGVGCFGFKLEGFECLATNELIERRLAVQKANQKCKYETGYIQGDISRVEVKAKLFDEIALWRRKENVKDIDVVIATPPCQGMSVANHKHNSNEIVRNSLIVESIKLVNEILPRVFIFENVPRFMATLCTDVDGVERTISDSISRNLGPSYSIYSRVLNFKDYGVPSSRTRTLVIGVRNDLANHVSPIELFPSSKKEVSLRQTIAHLKPLKELGEIDDNDIYHAFRPYPDNMRSWIAGLKQGESAFENSDAKNIPHQIINGTVVFNQQKNADKYRRQFWDKVGPCIHTRNDQLASQNTIHPNDDRVFSIRELMELMTVPPSFRWTPQESQVLNQLGNTEKRAFLKKQEMNIRQSLGEAVPTSIFREIASNFVKAFSSAHLTDAQVREEIKSASLCSSAALITYIEKNPKNLGFSSLSKIIEFANAQRQEQEAFFTDKSLVTDIVKRLPVLSEKKIKILEPSVGSGNFLPLLFKFYEDKEIEITCCDIDPHAIRALKAILTHVQRPKNLTINYITGDFLQTNFNEHFDLVIGNPPFSKSISSPLLKQYRALANNHVAKNTAAFFLEKSITLGRQVTLVMPKSLLNTPEYAATRVVLEKIRIDSIIDFGENGFGDVLIETISITLNTQKKPSKVTIVSSQMQGGMVSEQKYICDPEYPYWLIYRNSNFDKVAEKMKFDVFQVFRDRQITTKVLNEDGEIRVIKSRNIMDDGSGIVDIQGYDSYISSSIARKLSVYKFFDQEGLYLTPNMTYKPRVIIKPAGILVNGSVAILTLKPGERPFTKRQLRYFSTDEYRAFYRVARNFQTRSLNVDAASVFFFGRLLPDRSNFEVA